MRRGSNCFVFLSFVYLRRRFFAYHFSLLLVFFHRDRTDKSVCVNRVTTVEVFLFFFFMYNRDFNENMHGSLNLRTFSSNVRLKTNGIMNVFFSWVYFATEKNISMPREQFPSSLTLCFLYFVFLSRILFSMSSSI